MNTRAIVFSVGVGVLAGCGGPQGKLSVDTPVLAYQKPDISDITGIDEDSDTDTDSGSGSAAGSGSGSAGSGSGSATAAPGK
ncbi:MAG TPA: hypothetical protein VGF94_25155 [Kofleriaceae bacterium]|jgi:hypothetical protein